MATRRSSASFSPLRKAGGAIRDPSGCVYRLRPTRIRRRDFACSALYRICLNSSAPLAAAATIHWRGLTPCESKSGEARSALIEPNERQRITVFGGSRCGADSPEYEEALRLGRLLAEAGYDVCSGGYAGVMEAISQGAHDAGGHVIGVTMSQFKSAPNPYLKTTEPSADFYARLQRLIRQSVGYIALRGGMGTVTEISLVWNKLAMNVLPPRPLILLGECWPRTIACLREHLVISDRDLAWLSFVNSAEEAVAILTERAR